MNWLASLSVNLVRELFLLDSKECNELLKRRADECENESVVAAHRRSQLLREEDWRAEEREC